MENNYTPEQLETIRQHWKADPPKQCKGVCNIKEYHLEAVCVACGWCDDSTPVTGSNEYKN